MATTVLVTTAAEHLGLEENQLRLLLAPIYKNYETIKRISTKTLKTIAETLQEQALQQPENENIDVDAIEQEVTTEQPTLLQEQTDDFITDDAGNIATDISNDSSFTQKPSNENELFEPQETAITNIPQQEIEIKVRQVIDTNPALKQQVFDLSRITRTVALLSADKAVEDFSAIYAARFNRGVSAFIDDFSQTALTTITDIQNQKVTDFFEEIDLNYSTTNNQAIRQLKELMTLYQSPTQ